MYKIEFNEQMTINGILESFKNIKEAGEQAFIEINGIRIYHDEPKLESRITEEYRKYHETHRRTTEVRKEAPKKEKSLEETTGDALTNAFFLNNDPEFLFELGVVLEHTPEEKRKRLIDWYISVYGITSEQKSEDYKDLKYLSNLILILEDDCSLLKKRIQVQEMINSFSNDARSKYKFNSAITSLELYTEYKEQLNELLYSDVLKETIEEKQRTLVELEKVKKRNQQS